VVDHILLRCFLPRSRSGQEPQREALPKERAKHVPWISTERLPPSGYPLRMSRRSTRRHTSNVSAASPSQNPFGIEIYSTRSETMMRFGAQQRG
jgi:hypothetical protein